MESESTFVAPEGVYSIIEEHKPFFLVAHINAPASPFPTRVSTIVVRILPPNTAAVRPGFAQLLSVLATRTRTLGTGKRRAERTGIANQVVILGTTTDRLRWEGAEGCQ